MKKGGRKVEKREAATRKGKEDDRLKRWLEQPSKRSILAEKLKKKKKVEALSL